MKDYKKTSLYPKLFRVSFNKDRIYSRVARIHPVIIGQKYFVYTGAKFKPITPREEITSTSLGHYAFTKITGSSIHKRKRKKKEKKKRGRKK